jgi:hypothetical protein
VGTLTALPCKTELSMRTYSCGWSRAAWLFLTLQVHTDWLEAALGDLRDGSPAAEELLRLADALRAAQVRWRCVGYVGDHVVGVE